MTWLEDLYIGTFDLDDSTLLEGLQRDPLAVLEEPPGPMMKIPFSSTIVLFSDLRKLAVTIRFQRAGLRNVLYKQHFAEEAIHFAHPAQRDDFLNTMQQRLGSLFRHSDKQLTKASATVKPLLWACAVIVATYFLYRAAGGDFAPSGNRPSDSLLFKLAQTIGRPGVILVGAAALLGCAGWLARRVQDPPRIRRLKQRQFLTKAGEQLWVMREKRRVAEAEAMNRQSGQ